MMMMMMILMMLFWPEKFMTPIVTNILLFPKARPTLEAYAKVGAFMDVERIFRVMEVQNEMNVWDFLSKMWGLRWKCGRTLADFF